jgi:phosphodiesterase/alkaline phosphatase D-like protein
METLSRRRFLQSTGMAAGVLALGAVMPRQPHELNLIKQEDFF